jgi:hypothetical protein
LKVKTYPRFLKENIEVDLTELELNGNVRVEDVKAENYEILNSPRIPIGSCGRCCCQARGQKINIFLVEARLVVNRVFAIKAGRRPAGPIGQTLWFAENLLIFVESGFSAHIYRRGRYGDR